MRITTASGPSSSRTRSASIPVPGVKPILRRAVCPAPLTTGLRQQPTCICAATPRTRTNPALLNPAFRWYLSGFAPRHRAREATRFTPTPLLHVTTCSEDRLLPVRDRGGDGEEASWPMRGRSHGRGDQEGCRTQKGNAARTRSTGFRHTGRLRQA